MSGRVQARSRLKHSLTSDLRLARQAMVFGFASIVVAALLGLTPVVFRALAKSEAFTLWVVPVALVLAVAGVVSGIMGKAAEWRARRAQVAREWDNLVVSLLRLPVRDGRLPRLNELTNVDLGSTPTQYTATGEDDYLPRPEIDEKLCGTLASGGPPFPFVLLHGDAKAGKSRTMVQAARHTRPAAPIIIPLDGAAAAELARAEPPLSFELSPALVWLDDLNAADLDHLTAAVLDEWSDQALVIATMTTTRYQNVLRTGSEASVIARAALNRATVLELPFELSPEERAVAQQIYSKENFSPDGETPISIGEVLVGGDELVRKLHAGRHDCPAGQAVVRAAVDARRAGLSRPIHSDELKQLFSSYLRQVNSGIAPTEEQFVKGLEWAATPVTSQVAILRQVNDARWDVLDYIVEAEAGHHHVPRPIPKFLWSAVLAIAPPNDALSIADAASLAGRDDVVHAALARAQQHPHSALAATHYLGELLAGEGDTVAARAAYQQVIDSGHPRWAPAASYSLGLLFAEHGDVVGAKAAYQQVIDSGHVGGTVAATYRLGELFARQGDAVEAKAAYRQVVDWGDAEWTPRATYNLGLLLAEQGDVVGAKAAYKQAIDSGHRDWAPAANYVLGGLLAEQGDVAGAAAAYQNAINSSGHEHWKSLATIRLGGLLQELGDIESATAEYRQAADPSHINYWAPLSVQARQRLSRAAVPQAQPESRRSWLGRTWNRHFGVS